MKESIGAITIIKRILDLWVNLIIDKLLASAPAIEKQFIKAITKDDAVQFRFNTLELSIVNTQNSYLWYSIGSPKAPVRLVDSYKVTTFLDTGAEINIITRKVIEVARLAMQRSLKLELVSHTGHNHSFFSLYTDIEIGIGSLKIRHSIFVIEQENHDLVLDQLFLNSVKFSQKYKQNDIFGSITYSCT